MRRVLLLLSLSIPPSICPAETRGVEAADDGLSYDGFVFTGDVRYRYEAIDTLGAEHDRQRVRARLGVAADVSPSTQAVFRLSTGEGDPRSAHVTFSGGYSRKAVGVDLAYLDWHMPASLGAKLGKIPFPTWRPAQSFLTGGDFNPEGIALSYSPSAGFFATVFNFWLEDRSTASDSRQQGLQLGWAHSADRSNWTVALTLNDFTDVAGRRPFLDGESAYGNSVNLDGTLASDFEIADIAVEWSAEFYVGELTAFAHLARNSAAESGDEAYAAGLKVRPAQLSRWSAGYEYAHIGRDAVFGQHFDGDFGGGVTGSRGHVLRVAFDSSERVGARLSYFFNDVTPQQGEERGFRMLQLDIDCSF